MGGVLGCRWRQSKDWSKVRLDSKDGRRAVQIGLSKWSMGECRGLVKRVYFGGVQRWDGSTRSGREEGRRSEGKKRRRGEKKWVANKRESGDEDFVCRTIKHTNTRTLSLSISLANKQQQQNQHSPHRHRHLEPICSSFHVLCCILVLELFIDTTHQTNAMQYTEKYKMLVFFLSFFLASHPWSNDCEYTHSHGCNVKIEGTHFEVRYTRSPYVLGTTCRDSFSRNKPAPTSIAMLLVPTSLGLRSISKIGMSIAPQLQLCRKSLHGLLSSGTRCVCVGICICVRVQWKLIEQTPWLITLLFYYYYRYSYSRSHCHLSVRLIHPCAYLPISPISHSYSWFFLGRTRCPHLQCHLKSLYFIIIFASQCGRVETKTIAHNNTVVTLRCASALPCSPWSCPWRWCVTKRILFSSRALFSLPLSFLCQVCW